MAVVSSSEIAEQRRGPTFAGDGTLDRTYVRVFQVITDNYLDGGLEALIFGTEIPRLGAIYDTRPQGGHEFDAGAALVGYDPYQPDKDAPNLWYVRCDYSSKGPPPNEISSGSNSGVLPGKPTETQSGSTSGGGGFSENPLLRPTKISYRSQKGRRTMYGSLGYTLPNGDFVPTLIPFINSANQAYNPGPEVDRTFKILTIVRNEASYNPYTAAPYEDTVNSDMFLGIFQPGTVKCESIDGESAFENGRAFVVVTYTFAILFYYGIGGPWEWEPIDQGSYYLDGTKRIRPLDEAGNVISPVLLDGNGAQLADGDDPVINSFRIYSRKAFAPLKLP